MVQKLRRIPKYLRWQHQDKEERIAEALRAFHNTKNDDITNLTIAASVYDVPYGTLYDRYRGARSTADNGGGNKRINEAEEGLLIKYIDQAQAHCFPLNYRLITLAAATILKVAGKGEQRLGHDWANRWLKDMQEKGRYHTLNTSSMDWKRRAITPEVIMKYFERLYKVIQDEGILLCDLWNMDEAGFRVGCMKSTTVITSQNCKQVSICLNLNKFIY